ncbi:CHAT domain-containing protein [Suillus occidentalis]|nr:CHAT domain-containing protein [Suillus occidentalis]
MLRVVRRLIRPTTTRGNSPSQYIRVEIISATNLQVPSERIPAGIFISINIDSQRHWKSTIGVLSSEESVVWGDTVTLASYEADRMLGSGELIGKLKMSWDEVLNHGDEPFDIPFPPVNGVHPSLTLKVAVVHGCDDQDGALPDYCEITRRTDAGHAQFAKYMRRKMISRLRLNAAVKHFQFVLDQCPASHPDHAAALTNIAWARLKDIDTTISLFRDALALRPQRHPDRPISLYYLTEALTWRHVKTSTAADIREAAQLYHELLPLCPEGTYLRIIAAGESGVGYTHPMKASAFDESSSSSVRWVIKTVQEHSTSFQCSRITVTQSGNIDDLDECIQFRREAVSLCPGGQPDRDGYLNNLAYSLGFYRFDHQGNPNDLDEAISLHEEALLLCPVGHESRDISLGNLGGALVTRFNKRGARDDITRAIGLYREALTLSPPGHPRRDTTLNNLAFALDTRYDKFDVSEDLNEAIDLYRESLQLKGLDHPERHVTLFNLSSVLCSRFTDTRKNEDVEEAIDLCHRIAGGFTFTAPGQRTSDCHRVTLLKDYICVSHKAIDWARPAEVDQHESDLEAYQTCSFMCHTSWQSTAGRSNSWSRAVVQQWSLVSRLRTPLEDLESTSPDLAREVSELNKRLAGAQDSTGSTDRVAADRAATKYRGLTRQWESAVAEIRNLQGFSRFLLPPAYEDLQAAARHGPVIIPIASQYSCGAIIVPTSGEPHHIPLPSIALADLTILKERFTRAIRYASRMNPKETRTDLIVLLRIVWEEIMLPIVNVLENVLKPDRSKEPCLEDLYICSYTPTLSALVRSRQTMKKRVTPSFVTIGQGQPGAGKGKALLAVDSELELVRELVPATANRTTISGDAATRAGALDALEANTWVHLACHGKQDPEQPYHSHFVMRDEHLTLLDIMERDIPHAEFAFLSACHTAVGDKETPDEVIHLAAGLQFSGFKSVVGTLWEVDDSVAKTCR